MLNIKWIELFPTRGSLITFILYMVLFVFNAVFITGSMKKGGGYNYNTTLVVLLIETVKLIVSSILYHTHKKGNNPSLIKAILNEYKLMILYFIPSFLYCINNNLMFINLSHYDPTSYNILLQLRVVITALLFQCLFKKQLSVMQWLSLVMLTIGCMVKNMDTVSWSPNTNIVKDLFNVYILLIIFQCVCSCMAGTYNEYLLKNQGLDVDIFLQNVFMYIDSILCNIFFIIISGDLKNLTETLALEYLININVVLVIFTSAFVGIVTSFFLKNLNSILKTYASALELVFTAIVCYIIFDMPITICTIISISIVSFSVIIYFRNPVINMPEKKNDKKALLEGV